MAKSEKKKYTKKNITNKIHKSKKNSGTAKKKAFRKSKKSKKEGGFFNNEKQDEIDKLWNENQKLVNKFRNYKKKNQIEKMRETKNSIMENNMEIGTLNSGKKRPYKDTNDLIIDTESPLFNIPKQAQLDPLPPCWEQKFYKNGERFYKHKDREITRDKYHRPPPDYPCFGDEKGKYTTKRVYVHDDGRKSDQRPNSNEPFPKDVKEAKQEEKKDYETKMKDIRRQILAKEAKKAAAERARLEQRKKDAEAAAAKAEKAAKEKEAAEKAAKEKQEKAAKEKEAAEKEKAEQKKIDATWRDSDATWNVSYEAGK
jgi:hypothetical protein